MKSLNGIKRIISNQWTVSIIGTMIGVLAAFFLNDWRERTIAEEEMNTRLEKIYDELDSNKQRMQTNVHELGSFHEAISQVENLSDVRMSVNQMNELLSKTTWIHITDSTAIDGGYSYALGLNLKMLRNSEISDLAWTLSESSDAFTALSFDCLYSLQSTYALQTKLKSELEKLEDVILGAQPVVSIESFIQKKTQLILAYQKILLELYDFHNESRCHL